jgi:hypothetical protein
VDTIFQVQDGTFSFLIFFRTTSPLFNWNVARYQEGEGVMERSTTHRQGDLR